MNCSVCAALPKTWCFIGFKTSSKQTWFLLVQCVFFNLHLRDVIRENIIEGKSGSFLGLWAQGGHTDITKVKTEVWVCSAKVAGALQDYKGEPAPFGNLPPTQQPRQEGLQWAHVYFNVVCFSAQTTPWIILTSSAHSKKAFICKHHLHGGAHHEPRLPLGYFLIVHNVKVWLPAQPAHGLPGSADGRHMCAQHPHFIALVNKMKAFPPLLLSW